MAATRKKAAVRRRTPPDSVIAVARRILSPAEQVTLDQILQVLVCALPNTFRFLGEHLPGIIAICEARADYNALRTAAAAALEAGDDAKAIRLDKQVVARGKQVDDLFRAIIAGDPAAAEHPVTADPDGPGKFFT